MGVDERLVVLVGVELRLVVLVGVELRLVITFVDEAVLLLVVLAAGVRAGVVLRLSPFGVGLRRGVETPFAFPNLSRPTPCSPLAIFFAASVTLLSVSPLALHKPLLCGA